MSERTALKRPCRFENSLRVFKTKTEIKLILYNWGNYKTFGRHSGRSEPSLAFSCVAFMNVVGVKCFLNWLWRCHFRLAIRAPFFAMSTFNVYSVHKFYMSVEIPASTIKLFYWRGWVLVFHFSHCFFFTCSRTFLKVSNVISYE